MKSLLLALVAATLVGIALTGCGVGSVAGDRDPRVSGGATERSVGSGEETEARGLPEPLGSTLSYRGETVNAGLGSYCWSSASSAVCTDSIGISLSREALTVPAGATLGFEYGGRGLKALGATAHRIGRGNHLEKFGGDEFLLLDGDDEGYEGDKLRVRRSGNRASVVADMHGGEYVVEIFARMPEGSASYGFRVVVE